MLKLNLINFFITVFILCISALLCYFPISFDYISYPASLLYVGLIAWCGWSWKKSSGKYFDPYLLFLFSMFIFNGGHFIVQIFYPSETIILKPNYFWSTVLCSNFGDQTLLKTTIIVFCGTLFFHAGALFSKLVTFQKTFRQDISNNESPKYRNVDLKIVGFFLIAISIIPVILLESSAISLVIQGSYKLIQGASSDFGYGAAIRIMAAFLISGSFYLIAGSRDNKFLQSISLILILMYSFSEFIIGDRSEAVMPLIMLIYVYDRTVKEISMKKIVMVGSFLLFIILPLVQIVRLNTFLVKSDPSIIIDLLSQIDNPFLLIFGTTGNSLGVIARLIEIVPELHYFGFGDSYLRGISTVLPNLFWDKHPGSDLLGGNWFLLHFTSIENILLGFGTGFNLIGEAYYNFWWFGTIFMMFLIGFLFGKLLIWGDCKSSPIRVAFTGTFCSFIFQIPRGYLGTAFRPLVWYALIPFFLVLFTAIIRRFINRDIKEFNHKASL